MNQIWQGRVAQTAAKYGEVSQTATVCCNACRTCVTTNLLGLALGGLTAAALGVGRLGRRFLGRPS